MSNGKKITKLIHYLIKKIIKIIKFTWFMKKFHFPCSGKLAIKSNNRKNCRNKIYFIFDIFFRSNEQNK